VIVTFDRSRFAADWSSAGRRLGADADRGRAELLLAAIDHVPDPVAFVSGLVRRGDARERIAVLRVLADLPDPARFTELAIDSLRTNDLHVFTSVACDNPFPARFFDERAFGQMILKALFVGAPLARVVGLDARVTPELVRMVEAFASERRAAGRAIPDDATIILEWKP